MRYVLALLASLALVAACGTVKNTTSDGDDQALMLRGNDPVAYFTENKTVPGNPKIKADYAIYEERKKAGTLNPLTKKYGS